MALFVFPCHCPTEPEVRTAAAVAAHELAEREAAQQAAARAERHAGARAHARPPGHALLRVLRRRDAPCAAHSVSTPRSGECTPFPGSAEVRATTTLPNWPAGGTRPYIEQDHCSITGLCKCTEVT